MGKLRSVELQNSEGMLVDNEISNLEWALQFVKLKIQEMVNIFHLTLSILPFSQIFNGRKTDQCGVIIFGSDGIHHQSPPFPDITELAKQKPKIFLTKAAEIMRTLWNTSLSLNPARQPLQKLTHFNPHLFQAIV